MKKTILLHFLILALFVTVPALQSEPAPAAGPTSATNQSINLDLPANSSVKDLAEALARTNPDFGILFGPGANSIHLTEMSLRSADILGLCTAIKVAGGMNVDAGPINGKTLYIRTNEAPSGVAAFSIGTWLDGGDSHKRLLSLQEAIASTVASVARRDAIPLKVPEFQFYPDAKVLIVIGEQRALSLATEVVSAYKNSEPKAAASPAPAQR